jgi:hypothetical protein
MIKRPFFVLGAPTDAMITELNKFQPDAIFVNASFETFLNTTSVEPKKFDVHDMPTNFRAHADDPNKRQAGFDIKNVESFKLAQKNVSEAVKDLMEGKKYNKCNVFFASVPRSKRPFRIYVDETGKTVINDNGNSYIEQPDLDTFFKQIVLPEFGSSNEELTKTILKYSPEHKASYVVDTLSVISACLADTDAGHAKQKKLWDRYNLDVQVKKGMYTYDTKRNKHDIFHGAKDSEPEKGVDFCRVVSCDETDNGNIWSYKTSEIGALIGKTKGLMATFAHRYPTRHSKKWDEAFVWHDTFLNDIDDPVAISMIKKLTSGEVKECKNYTIVATSDFTAMVSNLKF